MKGTHQRIPNTLPWPSQNETDDSTKFQDRQMPAAWHLLLLAAELEEKPQQGGNREADKLWL